MPKKLPQETLNSVLSLLDSKSSHAEIISKTGVSSGYITQVTAKHRPHLKRSKGGRPRRLNPTNVRYVARLVTNVKKFSTRQATQALFKTTGKKVCASTVRRALKEAGLRAVKKAQNPKLSPKWIKA